MFKLLFKNKKLYIYTPLVIHWISIFFLTTIPTKSFPKIFAYDDKAKHLIAFLVLSFFLTLALRVQNKYRLLKEKFIVFTLLICSFYGIFDELHQLFVPGRSAEVLDWVADFVGTLIGIYLANKIIKKYSQYTESELGTQNE